MKTVLNINQVNTLNQPMFLGEDLGLQRYDILKYPKFMELRDKQITNFWRPQEVSLVRDRMDYERLTKTEKFIFESNLRWQTMTDSMLSRSIHEMTKYISNPELEACCTTWAFFETIHSESYTYILQNITREPGKFFDSIVADTEIQRRAAEIAANYDKLLGEPKDIKQALFDSVISTNITEALAFYSSFACSFYFGYSGKMEGNAKIISLIERDENLHVAITQNIVKYWRENPKEGFQQILKDNEQKVYDMYAMAVDNEKRWADYLFSQGSLLGLNAPLLKQYIEWLADNRLVSLGYKRIFNQKKNHLAGWLDSYSDSSRNQQAPQETELQAYKIASRDNEMSTSDFSDINL